VISTSARVGTASFTGPSTAIRSALADAAAERERVQPVRRRSHGADVRAESLQPHPDGQRRVGIARALGLKDGAHVRRPGQARQPGGGLQRGGDRPYLAWFVARGDLVTLVAPAPAAVGGPRDRSPPSGRRGR